MIFFGRVFFLCLHRTCTEDFVHPYLKVEHKKAERKERMGFLMPNNNRYEISEALQMPLPLTKEEAMQETLTQEESARTPLSDSAEQCKCDGDSHYSGDYAFRLHPLSECKPRGNARGYLRQRAEGGRGFALSAFYGIYEAVSGVVSHCDLPRRNRHKPSDRSALGRCSPAAFILLR